MHSFSFLCRFLMMSAMTATLALADASNDPEINLAPLSQSVTESNTTVTVELSLDAAPTKQDIVLRVRTVNGTARSTDGDFVAVDQILTFPEDDSTNLTRYITITINDDNEHEDSETFNVTVEDAGTSALQYFHFGADVVSVTINDDGDNIINNVDDLCYGPPTEQCILPAITNPLLLPVLNLLIGDGSVTVVNGVNYFACSLLELVQGLLPGIDILRQQTIPINHVNESNLTDVQVAADKAFLTIDTSILDWCGVDPSGSCDEQSLIDLGLIDLIDQGVLYELPDITPGDANSSIWITTPIGIDLNELLLGGTPQTFLYGSYVDENNYSHAGLIEACTGGYAFPEVPGTIADVVDYSESTSAAAYNAGTVKYIGTKVANKDNYYFDAVYLTDSGTTAGTYPAERDLELTVYVYLSNDMCTETYDFAGTPASTLALIQPGEDHATTRDPLQMPDYARKAMRLKIEARDWEEQFDAYGANVSCYNSDLEGSLCGVPSCLSSAEQASEAFPIDTTDPVTNADHARVLSECYGLTVDIDTGDIGNQISTTAACNVNNYNGSCGGDKDIILPEDYQHPYGCLACILNIKNEGYCSRDNFSLRPDRFVVTSSESHFPDLLRAGADYNLTVNAYNYNDFNNTADYNQSGGQGGYLTLVQHKWFKDGTAGNAGMFGFLEWSLWDFNMTNGISNRDDMASSFHEVAGIQFSDVGRVSVGVQDRIWTFVDQANPLDQTPSDCSADGAYICGEDNVTYIPYAFDMVDNNITNNNGRPGTFTYMANINPADSTTFNMGARVETKIRAVNKQNVTTHNFNAGAKYYENPVSVTFWAHDATQGDANTTRIVAQFLGFGTNGDENGTKTITWNETNTSRVLRFNFARATNIPINPFDINGTELDANASSLYTQDISMWPGHDPSATVDGNMSTDANGIANFYYGRLHAPRYRVNGNISDITLYYEVYCSPNADAVGKTCDVRKYPVVMADRILSVDDIHWYQNAEHNATYGTAINITERSNILGNPINEAFDIYAGPLEIWQMQYIDAANRGYPFKATMLMSTQPWLLYNRYNAGAPTNSFELEFNSGGVWQGKTTGNISVDSNASRNTNRRVDW